jgi:two-component system OmpR family sensor kinase
VAKAIVSKFEASMFLRSIRWRMQLWLAFLLVCILSGFGVTAYQLHRNNIFSQIDEDLARRVAALSADVRRPPPFLRAPSPGEFHPGDKFGPAGRGGPHGAGGPAGREPSPLEPGPSGFGDRPAREGDPNWRPGKPGQRWPPWGIELSAATLGLFDESLTNAHYFSIWSRDGERLKASTNAPAGLILPDRGTASTGTLNRTREGFREAYQFTELGDCILAGRSIVSDLRELARFAWLLVGAGASVLALGLGGGWVLAGQALRPVEKISATANRISLGNLAERIDVADTDSELGRLAGVLNSTFAKLEASFVQQKQFTADAAHELRTPLAVIIAEAQSTLARDRTAPEYRETVEGCLETAQQMRQLTQSLLELARFDAHQEHMQTEPFDLAKEARRCLELVRPLAEPRGIKLEMTLQPAIVRGDVHRVGELVTNLLSNALQFNKDSGEIRVETHEQDSFAVLTVADTGQGIAAADLPHVFERFFRADKSRSRTSGHSGLGLAICRAIVDAHSGSITVSSELNVGTCFTVRLPIDKSRETGGVTG